MSRAYERSTSAKASARDHSLLSRGSGGRPAGGGAIAAGVRAHEGGGASVLVTPARYHSRCRRRGRHLRRLAGREGISSPSHRPGASAGGRRPAPERGVTESDLFLSARGRAETALP